MKTITRMAILLNSMLFMGLTGCQTMLPKTQTTIPSTSESTTGQASSWQEREAVLRAIKNWQINGKIAVQTAKQSGSATVDWMQHGSQFNISIMGPLGAGSIKLHGRPGLVTLQTADGKTFTDSNPEHLLAKGWGYHLPLSQLNDWVRGLPSSQLSMKTTFDSKGRLSTLVQQGWVIQYLGYTKRGKVDLPDKIYINSPSLKVKIVIYQWQVG